MVGLVGSVLSKRGGGKKKKCFEGLAVPVFCITRLQRGLWNGGCKKMRKNRGKTGTFRYQSGTFRFLSGSLGAKTMVGDYKAGPGPEKRMEARR